MKNSKRTNYQLIEETKEFVRNYFKNVEPGHDWWHTYRVWKNAKKIYNEEKKRNKDLDNPESRLIVELSALLHDIEDYKFSGNEKLSGKVAENFLKGKLNEKTIKKITKVIDNISFKGAAEKQKIMFPELAIVQDADRLDAIGAIGIARAFSYGGFKKRPLYDPNEKPRQNMTKKEYLKNKGTTINHFYEKLLLLKDRMNTKTGKEMARQRHKFLKQFLREFFKEWNSRT